MKKVTVKQLKTMHNLGRELKISDNSLVTENSSGYNIEYCVDTIEVLIGIGKDHTASLIMDKEAWEVFKSGENIHIDGL